MATVTVTLDTSGKTPVVRTNPKQLEIDSKGETIHWVPAGGSPFTFVALVFEDENPFAGVVVQPGQITARDSNESYRIFRYRILVKDSNGNYYSSDTGPMSADSPTIRNN